MKENKTESKNEIDFKAISSWSDLYENMARDIAYHDRHKTFSDTAKECIKLRWKQLKEEGKV